MSKERNVKCKRQRKTKTSSHPLFVPYHGVLQIWYNPFITWNPEECGGIRKLGIATENLWLPDIFIEEL